MTREEKAQVIEELSEKFKKVPFFYILDGTGMTVEQVNKFRRLCFKEGFEYKVAKNTLIYKALETTGVDYTELKDKVLKGFSGVLFSTEAPNTPAKMLKKYFSEGNEKPALKAASIDTAVFIGADQLDTLAALKSKKELVGDIIGLLQSPAKNVVSALQSGSNTIAGLVKALSERES